MFTCDQLIAFLAIVHLFAIICVVVHDKKQARSADDIDFTRDENDEENELVIDEKQAEKIRSALFDIESCDTLISMYEDLYKSIYHELEYSRKESNVIKYKRQLITVESKINALQAKREKAYYIAYGEV